MPLDLGTDFRYTTKGTIYGKKLDLNKIHKFCFAKVDCNSMKDKPLTQIKY